MWALDNRTAYAAGRNWTRDREGVHWWIVAVRATFTVAPRGAVKLAEEQIPPVLTPEYFNILDKNNHIPGASSLRYDSDLLARKPGTDLIANASAHAPGGRATSTVLVTLQVGPLQKSLVVHGERAYSGGLSDLATTSPQPYTVRPIRYECAYGGADRSDPDPRGHRIDERNPVGRGFARTARSDTSAHSVEYPSGNPATRGPAGFGAIDPAWLPRRTLAGTYDAAWQANKRPLLPDDHDPAFALAAPIDQRFKVPLTGGESVQMTNLSPEGLLRFELPRIRLRLASRFGRRTQAHDPPLLTTVLLEPDDRRLSLTWQSALRVVSGEADYLDVTEIVESPNR